MTCIKYVNSSNIGKLEELKLAMQIIRNNMPDETNRKSDLSFRKVKRYVR